MKLCELQNCAAHDHTVHKQSREVGGTKTKMQMKTAQDERWYVTCLHVLKVRLCIGGIIIRRKSCSVHPARLHTLHGVSTHKIHWLHTQLCVKMLSVKTWKAEFKGTGPAKGTLAGEETQAEQTRNSGQGDGAHRPELIIVERVTAPETAIVLEHARSVHGDIEQVADKCDVLHSINAAYASVLV